MTAHTQTRALSTAGSALPPVTIQGSTRDRMGYRACFAFVLCGCCLPPCAESWVTSFSTCPRVVRRGRGSKVSGVAATAVTRRALPVREGTAAVFQRNSEVVDGVCHGLFVLQCMQKQASSAFHVTSASAVVLVAVIRLKIERACERQEER